MANARRHRPITQRERAASGALHHNLNEPSKQQLRDELAEAIRNTAALPVPRETSEASDER